jgi:hypothetical protein
MDEGKKDLDLDLEKREKKKNEGGRGVSLGHRQMRKIIFSESV